MATEHFSGNRMQSQVAEFHKKFGHPIGECPGFSRPELRARLILEEALETVQGLVGDATALDLVDEATKKLRAMPPSPVRPDMVEAVDGLCDLLYVTFGAAVEMGLDIQVFFDEVHRANLAKEGGPRRADGKTLKPTGWQPPRIREVLEAMGWRPPAPDAAWPGPSLLDPQLPGLREETDAEFRERVRAGGHAARQLVPALPENSRLPEN